MKKIEIGDRVEVLDDTIAGVVIQIDGNQATIESDDGFPMVFPIDKLVCDEGMMLNRNELNKAVWQERNSLKKPKVPKRKKSVEKPMEVDLHIEELIASTKFMSDYDMLNLQLDTAKNRLEFAIAKKIRRVVFIHGVGKGVLRAELETLFRRYEQVEFYDADFKTYGRGATEVYIYQNY